jgi:hypothetical protein
VGVKWGASKKTLTSRAGLVACAMFFETTTDNVHVSCADDSCTAMLYEEGAVSSKAVANLNIFSENPFEWWVARVLVPNPADRSRGYGSLVLQAALKAILVPTGGMARVIVAPGGYGVDADPERRVKFYEQNGFKRVNDEGLMEWRPRLLRETGA